MAAAVASSTVPVTGRPWFSWKLATAWATCIVVLFAIGCAARQITLDCEATPDGDNCPALATLAQ